jgi:nucleotide-binding universal stress UspA family protein
MPWPNGTRVHIMVVEPAIPEDVRARGGHRPAEGFAATASRGLPSTEQFEGLVSRLARAGLVYDVVSVPGCPAAVVASAARSLGTDLLVTTSRNRGLIAPLRRDRVVTYLVDAARMPVLVARSPQVPRILLATDGSSNAPQRGELPGDARDRGPGSYPCSQRRL